MSQIVRPSDEMLPGKRVDVGGYKLHIWCMGLESIPTVVLEAGMANFSLAWSLIQPEVAKFGRVCSYDRAGLGWSDPSPKPRTIETVVDDGKLAAAVSGAPPRRAVSLTFDEIR